MYKNFPRDAPFFCPVSPLDKVRLMRGIPRKAHYLRACIRSFWSMKITQDISFEDKVGAESPWHNARFPMIVDLATRTYFSETVEVLKLLDLLDGVTDQPFTDTEWRAEIKQRHMDNVHEVPSDTFLDEQVKNKKV